MDGASPTAGWNTTGPIVSGRCGQKNAGLTLDVDLYDSPLVDPLHIDATKFQLFVVSVLCARRFITNLTYI